MNTRLTTIAIAAFASAITLAGAASAASAPSAECPAAQMRPNARTTGETMPSKVTDTELSTLALGGEIKGLDNRRLRLRRLVIQPGGVVPWHSHGERPAIIYIVEGQIEEYASNCAVPIVHKAGEVVAETKGVSHWWKNLGDKTVVLLSADLLKDPNDKNM